MQPTHEQFDAGYPVDLIALLRPMQRGAGDPCLRLRPDGAWRAVTTPQGPATQQLTVPEPGLVHSRCWGPGAVWLSAHTPELLGTADDGAASFTPVHDAVIRAWARFGHRWRVPRGHAVWETIVAAVLEQKVTGLEATTAWRTLARRYGEPAPGPVPDDMRVFPPPEVVRLVPTWVWRRTGVDRARSDTIMRLTRLGHVLRRLPDETAQEARRLLTTVPGVGPWTYAEVAQRALGDADAVSVGDFHLGGEVVYALTGSMTGTDDEMLELLAPYAGQRYRAIRMLELAGLRRPRRGPRMTVPAHRTG